MLCFAAKGSVSQFRPLNRFFDHSVHTPNSPQKTFATYAFLRELKNNISAADKQLLNI